MGDCCFHRRLLGKGELEIFEPFEEVLVDKAADVEADAGLLLAN